MQEKVIIGESPSICPFLKNNGDEALKGPRHVVFQEWSDTTVFFYLKYTSTKRLWISNGKSYFTHVQEDIFYIVYIDFYLLTTTGK